MSNDLNTVFDRSGLAALSDLNTPESREIFSHLELMQDDFLSKESEFRSPGYSWPRDPLHKWSRVWEYPYCYYHLSNYSNKHVGNSSPVVVDVGSGVTFFPFAVARLGYQVICTDIDLNYQNDIHRASNSMDSTPGRVEFRLTDGRVLPFADEECDVVYCISVLEHIPSFENTINEIVRILKPNGLCVITCDLDLSSQGDTQLNLAEYKRLERLITQNFSVLAPERTIHPIDVLTSINSPYARPSGVVRLGFEFAKQKLLKPMLGRKSGPVKIKQLSVMSWVLTKPVGVNSEISLIDTV